MQCRTIKTQEQVFELRPKFRQISSYLLNLVPFLIKKNKIIYLNGTSTHFMHHETMLSKFNGKMIQFTINLFFCPHNIYNFSKIYLEQIFHNTYVFILWEFTNLGEELTINFFFFLQDTGYLKVFFVLGSCTLFKYEWKLIWIEDRKLNHIYFEYVNPFQ